MLLKGYNLFAPPMPFCYYELTRKQAKDYFDWFLAHIPSRLEQLRTALDWTGGKAIPLDYTLTSLAGLGEWFQRQVEIRARTHAEQEEEQSRMPAWFHEYITEWTLTDQTISLCYDIGIYFGEMMRHRHPEVHWDMLYKPKNHADVNQPIIVPFPDQVPLNPLQIAVVIAYKVVDDKKAEVELPKTFQVWERLLEPSRNKLTEPKKRSMKTAS